MAVTLLTVFLALLGYGYASAVESQFGISEELFADSPLDYLRLSKHVLVHWLTALPEILFSADLYLHLYREWSLLIYGLTVLWIVAMLAWKLTNAREQVLHKWVNVELFLPTSRLWQSFVRRAASWKWPFFSLIFIWGWLPMGVWVLAVALILFSFVFVFVPMLGLSSGQHSLQRWVVEPTVCMPVRSQSVRTAAKLTKLEEKKTVKAISPKPKPVRVVTCVRVRQMDAKDTSSDVQGRLVVATAKWLVLFSPDDGAVWRVPVQNARIDVIDSLSRSSEIPALVVPPFGARGQ